MHKMKLMPFFFILCTMLTQAYEFSFFNNTDNPIAIAIQYTGIDSVSEPLYGQLAKPHQMIIFTPGKIKIPDIKWGFCLDNMYYVENPTTEQKAYNFKKAPWRKILITWVKEKSVTKKEKKQTTAGKNTITPEKIAQKSLCRDRHFDIIQDAQGKIVITSSLND
jgi:hypothetical protein